MENYDSIYFLVFDIFKLTNPMEVLVEAKHRNRSGNLLHFHRQVQVSVHGKSFCLEHKILCCWCGGCAENAD